MPSVTKYEVEEKGLARYVIAKHPTMIYTKAYGWLTYTGTNWERGDQTEASVFNTISDTLEERRKYLRSHRVDEELVDQCEPTVRHISAVMKHVSAMRSTHVRELDAGPDFLNVANGLLDLRNGALQAHSPRQLYTYCLNVPYFADADDSEWRAFLAECVGGGDDVVRFLQRCVGYSLTGHTTEEKMFYVYGPSRSGKGVFTETLLSLLGVPLSTEVDFATFTRERQQDANNFDLAPLKPARFLAASESSRYERLNEAKVKQMTGGNYISCSFKYGDHFNYRPQYKIWLTSNHDVNADPHDAAVWGRIVRFEFPNSHQGHEDRTLKHRLVELPNLAGVLKWAVEGAEMWYKEGLTIPESLQQSLAATQYELDSVRHWIEERIEFAPGEFLSNVAVRQSYEGWCEANGVRALEARALGRTLATMEGFVRQKQKQTRGFVGMRLRNLGWMEET